ncbi:Leucine-responsive regulatory protein [Cognatishimia activa]|uniref:Leucine-responsive regulatory protein n=2 Tax=Cognatishimia activa TaxID=1715691 RepID=A0A0P1IQ98_9RHOB|nr:Lrp/AsnC family transcriptional regulator [Pseudomonadota bacterium]CUI84482.1 Leucine-responsive regulatory protein [Cognatishimia activa]CUK25703.1 Leucine-responsive regulatory protein [Cognatishimia activa]
MIEKMNKIDDIDRRVLDVMQRDAGLSQRDVADRVGLSQNALWRRLKRLDELGFIQGSRTRLNATQLGLDLTVFVMIRTRNHSIEWAEDFRKHVGRIPEVAEMHRIGGEWDYMLKVVTRGMSGYDAVYRKLTAGFDLDVVTGLFSMETMLDDRPLDVYG